MTFNIRYNNPDDGINAWPNRKELAGNTILSHEASIVGLQEALIGQIRDLENLLPNYKWCGKSRDDGKEAGEFSPIFYSTLKYELLSDTTLWLSETPDVPGSKSWNTACTRIVSCAKFKDKMWQKEFYFLNTHFDHISEEARTNSARVILNLIKSFTDDLPIILTGDFNCTEDDSAYKILTNKQDGLLKDTIYLSTGKHKGPNFTFNGFGNVTEKQRIDFIFVNSKVTVKNHRTLNIKEDDVYISDHYPVIAKIKIE